MTREISGLAVGVVLGGTVLAWSGLRGHNVSAVVRNLIAGKDPTNLPVTGAIALTNTGSGASATPSSFTASGSGLVDTARKYLGTPYKFGGWTPNGWDCSGAMNWWRGHDLGQVLPLRVHYSDKWHGPIALNYYMWSGAQTIPRSQAAPGDLACWPTHVGVVSGQNSMISAYSRQRGTAETPIDGYGPPGEILLIRRPLSTVMV